MALLFCIDVYQSLTVCLPDGTLVVGPLQLPPEEAQQKRLVSQSQLNGFRFDGSDKCPVPLPAPESDKAPPRLPQFAEDTPLAVGLPCGAVVPLWRRRQTLRFTLLAEAQRLGAVALRLFAGRHALAHANVAVTQVLLPVAIRQSQVEVVLEVGNNGLRLLGPEEHDGATHYRNENLQWMMMPAAKWAALPRSRQMEGEPEDLLARQHLASQLTELMELDYDTDSPAFGRLLCPASTPVAELVARMERCCCPCMAVVSQGQAFLFLVRRLGNETVERLTLRQDGSRWYLAAQDVFESVSALFRFYLEHLLPGVRSTLAPLFPMGDHPWDRLPAVSFMSTVDCCSAAFEWERCVPEGPEGQSGPESVAIQPNPEAAALVADALRMPLLRRVRGVVESLVLSGLSERASPSLPDLQRRLQQSQASPWDHRVIARLRQALLATAGRSQAASLTAKLAASAGCGRGASLATLEACFTTWVRCCAPWCPVVGGTGSGRARAGRRIGKCGGFSR
jgi:hypothetical protein